MASDPAYLREFKNFTNSSPSAADREAMEKEFYGQSDRACGVLHASWVDQMLETAIKGQLRANLSNKLFGFNGPLGTFSARIMMGYSLGLFGQKTNHDLLLIRTIRNEFAHCQLPLRFDIPEVKAVCDKLIIPDTQARVIPPYLIDVATDVNQPVSHWIDRAHPKTRFVVCCYSIIYQLFDMWRNFKPPPPPPSRLP